MKGSRLKRYRGRLGIAFSGGADSTCLADLAYRAGLDSEPILIHVDHGLRQGSGETALWLKEQCEKRQWLLKIAKVEVAEGSSLEGQARSARYAAFAELQIELELDWILLGHTANDQAETVLMRILRGTGIHGLAGIPEERPPYARPLLHCSREQTLAYCAQKKLRTFVDPMNSEERFARVRIRQSVLPMLRQENPSLDAALVRLSQSAAACQELLNYSASQLLLQTAKDSTIMLSEEWSLAPEAVRIRAIQVWMGAFPAGVLDSSHLRAVDELASGLSKGSREVHVPGGVVIREYDQLSWAHSLAQSSVCVSEPGFTVRIWQPGDRMRPVRLLGRSKKLSDLFGDAKVPRRRRIRAQVVVESASGEIVWAEHLGFAHGHEGLGVQYRHPSADDAT